jgi:hypothetical protein
LQSHSGRWIDTPVLPNILEGEGRAHAPGQTYSKGPNLHVDVGEVRQGRPSPHPHDGTVRHSTQFHCHGPLSPQAVGEDPIESVTLGHEAIVSSTPSYCNSQGCRVVCLH